MSIEWRGRQNTHGRQGRDRQGDETDTRERERERYAVRVRERERGHTNM